MHRNRSFVYTTLIAVLACSLTSRTWAQQKPVTLPHKTVAPTSHRRPSVPQEVFSPFWTVQPGWRTELMIRNNASQEMTVLPVLRSRTGTETNLEPVSIAPNASQSVSVADVLARVAPSIRSDADAYGSVVFRYNSVSAGHIYASTVVARTGSPVMFHFDAARTVPDFTAGSYQSIWWRPTRDDTETLVLANLGARDIQGNIRLLDAKGRSATHPFSIGPRQTQQVSLTELLNKDGLEGEFGGLAIEPGNSPGYLQVLQFNLNEVTGLGALLKVFPKSVLAEKQFTIRASMVALAHPDPALALPTETRLQPRIFLYNSTEHAIVAHLLIDWHSATEWGRKSVPDLKLAPGATQVLSLGESDEQKLGIPTTATWGSVEISYASDDGDLVALEASQSTDAKYLVQTPFTDALSFQFKGGAWMADADHTALITAGNAGTKPAKLDFKLWFGAATPYEFSIKTLQPGEAITVNVGSVITNQQPDRNGKTIPLSVTSGTYEFSDLADPYVGYLYEGKQQIDKTYGLATYGCAFCCYYDNGWIANFTGHPGDSGPIPATGEKDCQGNYSDWDITSSVSGWASSNSNVATVAPDLAHAVGPGQATSSGSATVRTYGSYKVCPSGLLAVAGLLQVLEPPPPTIKIMFGGSDITGTTQSVVVGQQIALTGSYTPSSGVTVSSRSWSVAGTKVGGFIVTPDFTSGTSSSTDFTQDSTTFYWITPGSSLNVMFTLNLSDGLQSSASATFNVSGPTGANVFTCGGNVTSCAKNGPLGTVNIGSGPVLELGGTSSNLGINFTASATPPSGYTNNFQWVQLITNDTVLITPNNGGAVQTCVPATKPVPSTGTGLDTRYPTDTTNPTEDNPDIALTSADKEISRTFSAKMYLMWSYGSAPSTSIPVPLGYVSWQFSGDAKQTNQQSNTWTLNSGSGSSGSFQASSSYPTWTSLVPYNGLLSCH